MHIELQQYQDLQQHTLAEAAAADMPAVDLRAEELAVADLTITHQHLEMELQIQAAELHQEQVDQVGVVLLHQVRDQTDQRVLLTQVVVVEVLLIPLVQVLLQVLVVKAL